MTVTLVSGLGEEASSSGLRYEYQGPGLTVSEIAPSIGPVEGGTHVTVIGCWRAQPSQLRCIFDGVKTATTLLSSSTVLCASPPHATAEPVKFGLEGLDGASASGQHSFEYHAVVSPIRVIP